jgi:hypothetical protein
MLSENHEMVAALAELARHYVLFAPGIVVQSSALPALVHWAVAAVQLREPEPVAPAAAFLSSLIAPPTQIASSQLWQARRPDCCSTCFCTELKLGCNCANTAVFQKARTQ